MLILDDSVKENQNNRAAERGCKHPILSEFVCERTVCNKGVKKCATSVQHWHQSAANFTVVTLNVISKTFVGKNNRISDIPTFS